MKHDDLVINAANILTDIGGTIYADLPISYNSKHNSAFRLTKRPPLILAAFVPTQASFTKMANVHNYNWHIPDIVIEKDEYKYIIDVIDNNDTYASMARKAEAVIFSANNDKIVGFSFLEKPPGKAYKGKLKELSCLKNTLCSILNIEHQNTDDPFIWMKSLLSLDQIQKIYGTVNWNKFKKFSSQDENWEQQLKQHIISELNSKTILTTICQKDNE